MSLQSAAIEEAALYSAVRDSQVTAPSQAFHVVEANTRDSPSMSILTTQGVRACPRRTFNSFRVCMHRIFTVWSPLQHPSQLSRQNPTVALLIAPTSHCSPKPNNVSASSRTSERYSARLEPLYQHSPPDTQQPIQAKDCHREMTKKTHAQQHTL